MYMFDRLKAALTQQRIIIVLTVLLVLAGAGVLYTSFYEGGSYDTATNYEKARKGGDLPQSAPTLPKCASNIKIGESDTAVTSISFDCSDLKERAAFVALVRSGFSWNIFVEGDRVTLQAVVPRQ